MAVNSSSRSVDAPIIATALTFSVYQLCFIAEDGFVLKYIFYLFALSSICSRYSTDLCKFTPVLSCFLRVLIFLDRLLVDHFFSQQWSREFLWICICATEIRIQPAAFPVICFMITFFRKTIDSILQYQRQQKHTPATLIRRVWGTYFMHLQGSWLIEKHSFFHIRSQ